MVDLSIVFVNWNSKDLLAQCLRSIETSGTRCAYEVIISDNASTDGSQEWLRELERTNPRVRCVFNPDNPGFGVGNNRALPYCQGRHVLFLNTDTIVLEPLDALVEAADQLGDRCGALGGRVLNADKSIQLTCREPYTLPIIIAGLMLAQIGIRPWFIRRQQLEDWDHAAARDVAILSGCYLLVPHHVLDEVGGFDPHIFLYYEDTDLCYRIRYAGYVVRYVPVSTIIHLGGGSSRSSGLSARALSESIVSMRYFVRKHMGRGHACILTLAIGLSALAMWCIFALFGLLSPLRGPRADARRRAHLLSHVLATILRQRTL
jgi:GT2 family glycosyltransferase